MTNAYKWITVGQAAKLSGYNEEHIRRLLRNGEITGRKFGILWQVNHLSMIAFLSKARSSEDRRHGPKKLPSKS
ncbi:MAG: helix-turn-helix domain-containing protein [Anaerolineales bacterium]